MKELLDFCEKREVEIYTRYDFICDGIIVKMRKKDIETQTVLSREVATSAGFGLTIRVILQQMADKLDKKETHENRPYLVECTEYGAPRILFPSREAVDDYIEREELKTWVQTAAGWDKIGNYTIAQLRAVKKILEEEIDHG